MPSEVLGHLLKLAQAGATIIFTENYPQDVPGYGNWKHAGKALRNYKSNFRKLLLSMRRWQLLIKRDHHYRKQLSICLGKSGVVPEEMKTRYGLQCIRRSHADGHHYFISSLQEKE